MISDEPKEDCLMIPHIKRRAPELMRCFIVGLICSVQKRMLCKFVYFVGVHAKDVQNAFLVSKP